MTLPEWNPPPSQPKDSHGRLIFLPAKLRGDLNVYYPGEGSDISAGTLLGGSGFELELTAQNESKSVEWQFATWAYMAGGWVKIVGAVVGDHISMELNAPATPDYALSGSTTACIKEGIGGGVNRYKADGAGTFHLDLAKKLEGTNALEAVPVPNEANLGHWDWTEDEVMVSNPGAGAYDLLDAGVRIHKHGGKVRVLGTMLLSFDPPSKTKRIFAQWKWKVTAQTHATKAAHNLDIVWGYTLGCPL